MKYLTLESAEHLAGIANMLELQGHDTEDYLIALGMEAPYLFVADNTGYSAGCKLFHPQWINLYLQPLGFQLKKNLVDADMLPIYLRTSGPAMLNMNIGKGLMRPVVCCSYAGGKYNFINIKPESSTAADTFTITTPTLKRRLSESVSVYTLERCAPASVDLIARLLASLHALNTYLPDVLNARKRTVTREEFADLQEHLFRPLMQDLLPMTPFMNDFMLTEELRLLNHDYRHVFTLNDHGPVMLEFKLPRYSIRQCVMWYREKIIDRLQELGASDDLIDQCMKETARYKKML